MFKFSLDNGVVKSGVKSLLINSVENVVFTLGSVDIFNLFKTVLAVKEFRELSLMYDIAIWFSETCDWSNDLCLIVWLVHAAFLVGLIK